MDYYKRAQELKDETIAHRRFFHAHAEVGLNTSKAVAYITEKLREYGYGPESCGHGVTASIGQVGKCILLRADMDALPMREESGEVFACPTGREAHTCGHDLHAAMLLSCAKMLKETENELTGRVKFMLQPAEETFEGAKDMIAHGILNGVDAALAFHVTSGHEGTGMFMYNAASALMASVDGFRITIKGKGCHGAYPHCGIDPVNIGVQVHLALQSLIAREVDPEKMCVLTIGKFQAGSAPNIIPESAVLEGTIRTKDTICRKHLTKRMKEVAEGVAASYGGSAEIQMLSEVPPLVCDPHLTEQMAGYLTAIPGMKGLRGISSSASEDFASIAEKVPSAFIYLSAGFTDERGNYPAHNPKVRFNEDVCPVGSAAYAICAANWLKDNL